MRKVTSSILRIRASDKVTLKNGEIRYRKTIDIGRDPVTGARRQKVITARTVAEFKQKIRTAVTSPTPADCGRRLVSDYLVNEWLPWKESTGIKPASAHRYERDITKHQIPAFGTKRLNEVHRRDVDRWVQAARKSYAPATVHARLAVFAQAMRQAYHWEYIERNPCDGVRIPFGGVEAPRQVWSVEQARHFLHATRDDPDHLLWRLLLIGGLRIGEALALAWSAVDFDAGVVRVTRTATKNREGKWIIGTSAKTVRSARSVDMDVQTMRLLRNRQPRSTRALVFPGQDGGLWSAVTPAVRLHAACTAHGLPRVTPHDLRHLSITLAMASGMNVAAVSARAGHANASITLSAYTHALPGATRVVANQLGELLNEPDDIRR